MYIVTVITEEQAKLFLCNFCYQVIVELASKIHSLVKRNIKHYIIMKSEFVNITQIATEVSFFKFQKGNLEY